MKGYFVERYDLSPNRPVWRLIDRETWHRWQTYNTSARCPYVATIYDSALASTICELLNAALRTETP